MTIFFLTYYYYGIYKPILDEMVNQGHDVTIVEDKLLPCDYYIVGGNRLKKYVYSFSRRHLNIEKKYWESLFIKHPDYDKFYDAVVCQPGLSFCPYLMERLRQRNPHIKSCVMIHDSSSYYDFYHYKNLYDRVYTYDYKDARNIEGVSVLGAYWVPTEKSAIKYDLVMIGSDHDDRFEIIKKIYPQLKVSGLRLFLKVVSLKPEIPNSILLRAKNHILRLIHKQPNPIVEWKKKMEYDFVTDKPIPVEEVRDIISSALCILETDREGQAGITLRDMWALASGKKIISTNTFLKETPFFSDEQIRFIDRNNPILDIDFIKERKSFPIKRELLNQRIDNWVKRLLDFSV